MNATDSELRPAYRTLNEPTRLLCLSIAGWTVLLVAGGAGYGWLMVSPVSWRLNFTLAALVLGAPAALLLLREQSTITPARLLVAVVRWRARPAVLVAPTAERSVRRGGLRLDSPPPPTAGLVVDVDELPWLEQATTNGTPS
jgi:hypothetical protein